MFEVSVKRFLKDKRKVASREHKNKPIKTELKLIKECLFLIVTVRLKDVH